MALSSRRVQSSLHLLVREELQARGWTNAQLAARLGVRSGVVSRWLTDDPPPKRVVPLPQACQQIADVFGWKVTDVMRAAGYLPQMEQPSTPHEDEIRAAVRRLERTLAGIPEHEWSLAYGVVLAYLDGLQLILNRLDGD